MKNTLHFTILLLLGSSFLSSCSPKSNSENNETKTQEKEQVYTLTTDSTALKWTAFKTTQRIGVSGSFDSIFIDAKNTTGTIPELLTNARITINTTSVNSNNAIRDPKIVSFFFGAFSVPNEILGTIDSVVNDNIYIEITMNGIKKTVIANYSIDTLLLDINTVIHLPDWNAEGGLSALNKECDDLHKGEDGISKLWPEVAINITCPLKQVE